MKLLITGDCGSLRGNLSPHESYQRVIFADLAKAQQVLQWAPGVSAFDGVSKMVDWISSR
ncbi:hypothetical protein [Limnobacter sp.]|uniref:hypothetical protein n=1 Tax=Limnobacter sp. TaxID=2003368 RepID=UPI00311FAC35